MRTARIAAFAAGYILSILGANWAITRYGAVPVWPWPLLLAPAGVYFAGLTFTFRDLLQDAAGRIWITVAIVTGALLSAWIAGPKIAIASGTAFLLSELADFAVYARLRRRSNRSRLLAVFASNTIGAAIDSALFLWLARKVLPAPWPTLWPGQVVGKTWTTLAFIALLALIGLIGRRRRSTG